MQRYGPPPSYPNLKIAGLNAPIPEVSAVCLLVLEIKKFEWSGGKGRVMADD